MSFQKAGKKTEVIEDEDQKNNKPVKSKYKVLKGLEYPRGKVHEKDAVLELTDEEAKGFANGLIEEVEEDGDNL